jgi:hypothetical protein
MGATNDQPWHFEAPLDRRALRLRAGLGFAAVLVLGAASGAAAVRGSVVGTIIGAAAAVVFGVLTVASWRLSRISGSPLILDEHGMFYEDGLGPRSFLPWERVTEVALRSGLLGRRVVVHLDENGHDLTLPAVCHAGAPPEWTAGVIETFRQHHLHKS